MKCPDCDDEVLATTTGLHLNPQRSRFGRYLRDGTTATAEAIRSHAPAYFEHVCTPATRPQPTEQTALF